MRQSILMLAALVVCLAVTPAMAQWDITFSDETATRLSAPSSLALTNPDEKDYAWGDVDQDGDIDLVAVYKEPETTPGRRRNMFFMNENGVLVDRSAEYAENSTVAGSNGFADLTNDRDVQLVDVNGDGWLDIVTATTLSGNAPKYISHPRVYINLGNDESGDWQGWIFDDEDRIPTFPAEPRFCAVAVGDIDGDDDIDLYFGDYQQQPFGWPDRPVDLNDQLLINLGNGFFVNQTTARMTFIMVESSFCPAAVMADMNGNGKLDILKDDALNAPQAASIAYNNHDNSTNDGFFTAYELVYQFSAYHINVGDLNNDGLLDLVHSDDNQDFYQLNTGNGSDGLANFTPRIAFGGSQSHFDSNNLVADLDKDGWNDVVIANFDVDEGSCTQSSSIYHNKGFSDAGNFNVLIQKEGNIGIASNHLQGVHDFGVFDLNGDTWLDLVIGNCNGTRVYINQPPLGVNFSFPSGDPPANLVPDEPTTIEIEAAAFGADIESGTATLSYSVDGGAFQSAAMADLGDGLFEATIPAQPCLATVNYFFAVDLESSGTFTHPAGAPGAGTFESMSALSSEFVVQENFEEPVVEWTITSDESLTAGEWEQDKPNGTTDAGNPAAPDTDGDNDPGTVIAFITENGLVGGTAGANDIDGGPTILTSPTIDLDASDAIISFNYWFYTRLGTPDSLIVEVSNDNGANWTQVMAFTENTPTWQAVSFRVGEFIAPTANTRFRFVASDSPNDSVTEAGIDNVDVEKFLCGVPQPCNCPGDVVDDSTLNGLDIQAFVDCKLGDGTNCGCANGTITDFVNDLVGGATCD